MYNSTVGFSKYEFNNKLLGGVTLLKVTPSVTLSNIISLNNLLLNSYFENHIVNYMFYMFLTCIPFFMPIKCYLPLNPKTHFLCIVLSYKMLDEKSG